MRQEFDSNDINAVERLYLQKIKEQRLLDIGAALAVLEYDSDYRKMILAKHANGSLVLGKSAAVSEHFARALPEWSEDMKRQQKLFEDAAAINKQWHNLQNSIDFCRTTMSRLNKATQMP